MNFATEDRLCFRSLKNISLLLVPAGIVYMALLLNSAKGPFWLGNLFEAEYSYLMNSLAVSQGLQVLHADHPGSTLQLLGGLLLHAVHLLAGKGDLVSDVVSRPEFYLFSLYLVLVALLFATLALAGFLTLRWTGDYIAAILVQAAIPLSHTVRFFALPRMKPELLLVILAGWITIVVLYHFHLVQEGRRREPFWQYGLVAGLGIALKITFVPVSLLPLILLRGIKNRLGYIAATSAVFFAVAANPLMNFNGFRQFLLGHLVARQGYNKPIVEGSSKLQAMVQGFDRLADYFTGSEQVLLWLPAALLCAGLLAVLIGFFRKGAASESLYRRLWLGTLIVLACQFFLVANGPDAKSHYIIPATGLLGLVAFIAWSWPLTVVGNNHAARLLYSCAFLLFFGFLSVSVLAKLPREVRYLEQEAAGWLEASQFRIDHNLADVPTIYYYQSSNVQFALAFGNNVSGRHFSSQLIQLYPYCYNFHIWSRTLWSNFGNDIVQLDDIVRKHGQVLVQGSYTYPPTIPGLAREEYPATQKKHYRMSGAVIPAHEGSSLAAEVLFKGKREWLVLVRPADFRGAEAAKQEN